jgi:hypothetical protein
MRETDMKKTPIAILLTLALLVGGSAVVMIGCGSESQPVAPVAPEQTGDKLVMPPDAETAVWSENNHLYIYVPESTNITWDEAQKIAESISYCGVTGHLATITTAAENDFLNQAFNGVRHTYIGGYWDGSVSSDINVGWKWITGESWTFENWMGGEPNAVNCGTRDGQFYLELFTGSATVWNDTNVDCGQYGYMIELDLERTPVNTRLTPNSL